MIEVYRADATQVRGDRVAADAIPDEAIWIDLINPSKQEEQAVERLCAIEVPTREEMREIEVSSRLYSEDGADFMTASVVFGLDSGRPAFAPVTFILTGSRLVTLRYTEPKSFAIYSAKLCRGQTETSAALAHVLGADEREPQTPASAPSSKNGPRIPTADSILIGLLETVIDRVADMLEAIAADLDHIATDIFASSKDKKPIANHEFKELLRRIGAAGDLASRTRESLATLDRMMPYLQFVLEGRKAGKDSRFRVKAMNRDITSLNDFVSFLSNKTTFLLDTTVGMISIEQNAIIKIFSVAAVGFMPPTLIASIYGMNFEIMPELHWAHGYPLALVAMIVSAVLPLVFFRYKNWL
ncbi:MULTISPECIES: magnesium transporter CorA family protein [unclassified Aureimonas]|uniref:magnesium transporter CorA family protein n=1 Tax=unclassified Aureimonas TaxID=2615206 RepID=UPI0006F93A19|nr:MULTISPECIES: magnesium transporter CorA family protein [unclassified Aureimonas]KQT66222.1 magnesium transporter [Aureimonas sp. Leaf427]KQT72411.1 magnesium transporter [Aureimonas sp. Leaf460]